MEGLSLLGVDVGAEFLIAVEDGAGILIGLDGGAGVGFPYAIYIVGSGGGEGVLVAGSGRVEVGA